MGNKGRQQQRRAARIEASVVALGYAGGDLDLELEAVLGLGCRVSGCCRSLFF